jgi:hypothetical protein
MKLLAIVLVFGVCAQVLADLEFESLGEPVRIRELGPQFVTLHPDGYHQMWGSYQGVDGIALIGIRTDTGQTTRVSLDQFGRGKLPRSHARGREAEVHHDGRGQR